ncbi:MAG: chemotaxis protein CheC [Lachnospiraceae bacterium]|nr:chemotaxis protein CheC [Lachnospiraceae bacterium]MCI9013377.1 chemotaxis protein CheC [Lachnospiraceae bacterium]MCI9253729.1 chemotaxis protein CheC [Lachnospiraceae bacterium]MDE6901317.1 chemotaxis protein CheC [Lachnospiraceae bacterium]
MGGITLEEMSDEYFDVLKELGNIGAGNATTALSQMMQCKVDMSVPQVRLMEFKELGKIMGGEEIIMAGIYLGIEGDIAGSIMFLLEKQAARHLVDKLMGMSMEGEEFSEMEFSALKEVGNIITAAYLNSLSSLTGLRIQPSVPDLTVDMAGAILSVPAIEFGTLGDKMLLIQTQFFDEMVLDGYFILVPNLDSYGKILSALGLVH